MNTFRGGVHPEGHKELTKDITFKAYLPKGDLVFPLSQHIGKPADPVVKKGDQVLAGQIIAEASGFISANVISSVSGKVKAISKQPFGAGNSVMSIVIENDGEYKTMEGIGEYTNEADLTDADIVERVKRAGITGMGGAGFPTHVKLMPKNAAEIKYVIANGAECEPYITCDDRLMISKSKEIKEGMELILRLFPNAEGVIVIEDNKPDAINAMKAACSGSRVTVMPVPTKYPQGGERSIIDVVAGKHPKFGVLPADLGCIVDNVATIYAIYRAVIYNEPLMERGFTVTGEAIANPGNFWVKLGTNVKELLDECSGFKEGIQCEKMMFGGPMMGIAMAKENVPVCKNNNAITCVVKDPVAEAEKQMTACLRCGRCNQICPEGLVPQQMAFAAEQKNYERFEKKLYGLECIQCGSCTYVCPAKRPLMQLFKLAKSEIMAAKRK